MFNLLSLKTRAAAVLFLVFFLSRPYVSFSGQPLILGGGNGRVQLTPYSQLVYDLPFDSMIEQLSSLAKIATWEDAWLYVRDTERLYDVGFTDGQSSPNAFFAPQFLYKTPDILNGRETVHIRNHPVGTDSWIYPPSFNDLLLFARYKKEFNSRFNASSVAMVFDGFGVWEYDLSEELVVKLLDPTKAKEIQTALSHLRNIIHQGNGQTQDREVAVSRYIEEVGKVGITLTYKDL